MKKLVTAVIAFGLILGSTSAINAAVRADLTKPEQGINISEGETFGHQPPAMFGFEGGNPDPYFTFCNSLKDKVLVSFLCGLGDSIAQLCHALVNLVLLSTSI